MVYILSYLLKSQINLFMGNTMFDSRTIFWQQYYLGSPIHDKFLVNLLEDNYFKTSLHVHCMLCLRNRKFMIPWREANPGLILEKHEELALASPEGFDKQQAI
ncbi:hypothetical protein Ciccas_003477 [Cichlidogyrus casuarinus]|uniref:Uncharacterized protein n=1 Tax=Cichlidogyrus casuarinus TaxID=1844966 RepID=A0ABD2QE90_9PLAT